MLLESIREKLYPKEERDAAFQQFLERLSASGLRALALVEIAAPLLLQSGRAGAAMIAVGVFTLLLGRMRSASRMLGAWSAWAAAALPLAIAPWQGGEFASGVSILAAITLVLVAAAALLPLLPWQTLLLGLAAEGVYILSSGLARHSEFSRTAAAGEAQYILLMLLPPLLAGVSAATYRRWRSEFAAQREAVGAARTLAGARLRTHLTESAISVGKMAAALSHEINSPLGTLRSSIDTLAALTEREADAPPEERARLAATRDELVRSMGESAARIDEVTRHLSRFVILEDSEVKSADLNELLSDVTLLHQSELEAHQVQLDVSFEPDVPALYCRPQLLSAAFSTLLSNAIQAVNGDGRIGIETRLQGGQVEVTIRDNGCGMSAEEAGTIFEPSFKVADGRVASGNWGLFNSRQIVFEHGGDIRLETEEGQGTAVHVTLPVS
jgi:signal transduction histidine kinase